MIDFSIGRVAAAYAANKSGAVGEAILPKSVAPTGAQAVGETDFGDFIDAQIQKTTEIVQRAEKTSLAAVMGKASAQDVVQSVIAAETTIQTVVAIRDRMVQAYQEIARMPI